MATVGELAEARELFRNLTLRELRGKYKRSALGWAWSLVNPLVTMVLFTLVFRYILNIAPEEGSPSGLKSFPFFLMAGLLPWNFLLAGITNGMGAPLANGGLIKKVYFPREVLTASVVASWAIQFLIELTVLLVAFVFVGNVTLVYLPGILLVVAIQTMFIYGLAVGLGAVNVYFRDVQHFLGLAMQLWFYATPIVYPISLIEDKKVEVFGLVKLETLYGLNPMVRFLNMYRDLMYDLRWPAIADLSYVLGITIAVVAIGRWTFLKLEPRFAEEL